MREKIKSQFSRADREGLLELLERKAEQKRNRFPKQPLFESECKYLKKLIRCENGLSICSMNFDFNAGLTEGGHDPDGIHNKTMREVLKCFSDYAKNPKRRTLESTFYLKELTKAFSDCDYTRSEWVLKLMPDKMKSSAAYTLLLDEFLRELYDDVVISKRSWQPCKAAVVEQVSCYHPVKEVRLASLEILISNDIGSGVANNDIGSEICEMTGCEWIWDSYPDAQSAEGHRIADPYCPVHGDKFYSDDAKKNLFKKWTELIEKYSSEKIKGANYR